MFLVRHKKMTVILIIHEKTKIKHFLNLSMLKNKKE